METVFIDINKPHRMVRIEAEVIYETHEGEIEDIKIEWASVERCGRIREIKVTENISEMIIKAFLEKMDEMRKEAKS